MLEKLPITLYDLKLIKKYSLILVLSLIIVFLLGNGITALVRDSVSVNEKSYKLIDGFPMFTSGKDYIKTIKNYPYNIDVKIIIHKIKKGQSYWDIANKYKITIDTLIAANPFIEKLISSEGMEIAVPLEDGVLFAFDDYFDVGRMAEMLKTEKNQIKGKYKPALFKIISTDDIRFVFFKNREPLLVNSPLQKLYRLKQIFRSPVNGYYTSTFGDRIDPFLRTIEFHNGIDIISRYGDPIYPTREGMITYTGWRDGYGKTIIIQHPDGYTTLYGHCSLIKTKKGDWVTKKDVIALVGSTGRSTGPHVHFTVWHHGKLLNPVNFIW